MSRTPLIELVHTGDLFQAYFAVQGNGFVGSGLLKAPRANRAGEPCAGADQPAM